VPDILGMDLKLGPKPLLFKSACKGSQQFDHGKVYSSLYKFEGRIVLYVLCTQPLRNLLMGYQLHGCGQGWETN